MFANRIEYCNLVERRRLAEVREMVQPLQRGLAAVVPARALRLLTWREMEVLVAGSLEINTDVLVRRVAKRAAERSGHSFTHSLCVSHTPQRKHTEYEGYVRSDRAVRLFWQVFDTFSNEDKSLFLRFAWGRYAASCSIVLFVWVLKC